MRHQYKVLSDAEKAQMLKIRRCLIWRRNGEL
jgi:hypothetical protein